MEEPSEKIVEFESFDNVIKANIIKTKLDAYGIPCFLTGENFVHLLPFKNELFPGVRLYVFERDLDNVREILIEEPIQEEDAVRCPQCASLNIDVEDVSVAVIVPFIDRKYVCHCNDCHVEFSR